MKLILSVALSIHFLALLGQSPVNKHLFCEKRFEEKGVTWKYCDHTSERFGNQDTIILFRQGSREQTTGVEKCLSNNKCWRFYHRRSFKESYPHDKSDAESDVFVYKVSCDKKSKLYRLTVRSEEENYTRYLYQIYQIFRDSNQLTKKIILVKVKNTMPVIKQKTQR